VSTLRQLVQDRIAAKETDFKEVAGAAGMANVLAGRLADPGCYVFTDSSDAQHNGHVRTVAQREIIQLTIVITCRNVRSARGADADDTSQALRDSVRAILLGWTPAAGYEPLWKVDHKLISFANGFLTTADRYRTARMITKP
jgi:hypothetical protein